MGGPVPMRNKDMFRKPIRFKRQIQNTDLYRQQRAFALMRAGNKCENCHGAIGELSSQNNVIKQLDMHHLIAFDEIVAEYKITSLAQARMCMKLWDVKLVKILCHDCHVDEDASYGTGKSGKKNK